MSTGGWRRRLSLVPSPRLVLEPVAATGGAGPGGRQAPLPWR